MIEWLYDCMKCMDAWIERFMQRSQRRCRGPQRRIKRFVIPMKIGIFLSRNDAEKISA
jgi:hypothetical protein